MKIVSNSIFVYLKRCTPTYVNSIFNKNIFPKILLKNQKNLSCNLSRKKESLPFQKLPINTDMLCLKPFYSRYGNRDKWKL